MVEGKSVRDLVVGLDPIEQTRWQGWTGNAAHVVRVELQAKLRWSTY